MEFHHILVSRNDDFTTITMNRPEKRNALSESHLKELQAAFSLVGESDARGVILEGKGSVFSAGHDFSEMAGSDVSFMRRLFSVCTQTMNTIQEIPQPVLAKVGGLATAAGCQLVATCDLAVASSTAAFATPGGKGGLFCHTPMVAVARNLTRKQAFEMAYTGDPIDAQTALEWGFVNSVVAPEDLDGAAVELLRRATRGSSYSKAVGKSVMYRQLGLSQDDAYSVAIEAMTAASQTHDAQEGMAAFLEKRKPKWDNR